MKLLILSLVLQLLCSTMHCSSVYLAAVSHDKKRSFVHEHVIPEKALKRLSLMLATAASKEEQTSQIVFSEEPITNPYESQGLIYMPVQPTPVSIDRALKYICSYLAKQEEGSISNVSALYPLLMASQVSQGAAKRPHDGLLGLNGLSSSFNTGKEEHAVIAYLNYANGYFMVLYGHPMFENTVFKKSSRGLEMIVFAPKSYEEHSLNDQPGSERLIPDEHKAVLDAVLFMKKDLSAATLLDEIHTEKWYTSTSDGGIISNKTIRKEFKHEKSVIPFFLAQIERASTLEELTESIDSMRVYLSYWCSLDDLDLGTMKKDLIRAGAIYDKFRETRWKYGAWENQERSFDAFVGHLFFPMQLELSLDEIPELLCTRLKLQKMLAISAGYGNPLAHYYFNTVIEFMHGLIDETSEDNLSHDSAMPFLPDNISSLVRGATSSMRGPAYFTALLCRELGEHESFKANLRIAFEGKLPEAGFLLIPTLEDDSEKNLIFRNLEAFHPGYAKLIEAQHCSDLDRKIALFEVAGSLGVAYGYKVAGDLLKASSRSEQALNDFINAAKQGFLSGYSEAAQLFLEGNEFDKSVHMHALRGKHGAEDGYCKAGDICLTSNAQDDAQGYYLLGDIIGYQQHEKVIFSSFASHYTEQTYKAKLSEHLRSLLSSANYSIET